MTLGLLAFAAACGGTEDEVAGLEYYSGAASAGLGAGENQARCATCHSNDGSLRGFSGNTFANIAYHTSFKGGDAPDLLAGSNACITGWMGGVALAADSEAWEALELYLQSISDPAMTAPNALAPEVLEDEAAYETKYGGGDANAGSAKYLASCGTCHSSVLKVGDVPSLPLEQLKLRTIGRIAQKVRTSGPPPSGTRDAADTTPGPMPFFEAPELPDTDLRDIIAFVKR
jgi:mono/diheme cytochrome c family protein